MPIILPETSPKTSVEIQAEVFTHSFVLFTQNLHEENIDVNELIANPSSSLEERMWRTVRVIDAVMAGEAKSPWIQLIHDPGRFSKSNRTIYHNRMHIFDNTRAWGSDPRGSQWIETDLPILVAEEFLYRQFDGWEIQGVWPSFDIEGGQISLFWQPDGRGGADHSHYYIGLEPDNLPW